MEKLTYKQLREIAISQGLPDNKITIGIWAKLNGYIRHHIAKPDGKQWYFYTKDKD